MGQTDWKLPKRGSRLVNSMKPEKKCGDRIDLYSKTFQRGPSVTVTVVLSKTGQQH